LEEAADQQQQFHYLFVLRNAERGWTPELRSRYFEHLRRLDDFVGGEGMPTFRRLIRQEAIASLPEAERPKFAALLEAGRPSWHAEIPTDKREHVRKWKPADFADESFDFTQPRNLENGRRVFDAAACVRCHRMGRRGEAS